MRTEQLDRDQYQRHLAALSAMSTKKAQITYACEVMHGQGLKLSGGSVQAWLATFGVEVGRSSAATQITHWCAENAIVRTSDLPALTAEMLNTLDAARANTPASVTPNSSAEQSEQLDRTATAVLGLADKAVTEQRTVFAPNTEQAQPEHSSTVSGRGEGEQPNSSTGQSEHRLHADTEQSDEQLGTTEASTEHAVFAPDSQDEGDVPVPLTSPSGSIVEQPTRFDGADTAVLDSAQVCDDATEHATKQLPLSGANTEQTSTEHRTVRPNIEPVLGVDDTETAPNTTRIGQTEQLGRTERTAVRPDSGQPSGQSEHSAVRGEDAKATKPLVVWPVMLMALSAFVSIWSGWVGLGEMTGFGVVKVLPGISEFELNTAITLPIGVEAYASYALYVWLSGRTRTESTLRFAKWSAIASLALGAAGQIAYHLLMQSQANELNAARAAAAELATATGQKVAEVHAIAPWWITTFVACLPVIVVGMGAALAHMVLRDRGH